jgi:hypothetical protein
VSLVVLSVPQSREERRRRCEGWAEAQGSEQCGTCCVCLAHSTKPGCGFGVFQPMWREIQPIATRARQSARGVYDTQHKDDHLQHGQAFLLSLTVRGGRPTRLRHTCITTTLMQKRSRPHTVALHTACYHSTGLSDRGNRRGVKQPWHCASLPACVPPCAMRTRRG